MNAVQLIAGALMLAASGVVLAQPAPAAPAAPAASAADHAGHHASAPADDFATGEVRRIDKGAGKITLRHGEIRNLGMPPMTMVFQAADPAFLERVKVGDKVRFRAAQVDGTYRVIELAPAP